MSPRKATRKKRPPKSSAMLERITAFNNAKGGGVLIEKRSKGYSLFREDILAITCDPHLIQSGNARSLSWHINSLVIFYPKERLLGFSTNASHGGSHLGGKGPKCPIDGFLRGQAALAELVIKAAALDIVWAIQFLAGRRLCGRNSTEIWSPFLCGYHGELLRKNSFASVTRAKHLQPQDCGLTHIHIRDKSSGCVDGVQASLVQ